MNDTETINRRQDAPMATPEPPLHSGASAPAHIYRPFTVNGPYGAHRLYNYRGPWMPPIDYGTDPRHVRSVRRLSIFQGAILPLLCIPIASLSLYGRDVFAAIPGASGLGRLGARLLPIIDLIAASHTDPKPWQVAMTLNILAMLAVCGMVFFKWANVFQREGYSDLSLILYSKYWRTQNVKTTALAACRRTFHAYNVLYGAILLLMGSAITGLWAAPSGSLYIRLLDLGLFDGRILTDPTPALPGFMAAMTQAQQSLGALLYLMVGQDMVLWMILSGLFYIGLWPLRRAAYRNDLAYVKAGIMMGSDN